MNVSLTKFLKGFYRSITRITKEDKIRFSDFYSAFENGEISFISVNTVVHSDLDDELAKQIADNIDSLIAINRRPRKYLRSEEVIRPVELSKNINNRTIYELSKDSANWRRLNIDGVEPSKLLTEVNEDDFSIYENRIYKTLLDKLGAKLDVMVQKRQTLYENVKKANRISANLVNRYKNALLFRRIAPKELDDLNKVDILAVEESLKHVKSLSKKISFLKTQNLYQELRNQKAVVSPLQKTNILLQERHYKKMCELWDACDKHKIMEQEGNKDKSK